MVYWRLMIASGPTPHNPSSIGDQQSTITRLLDLATFDFYSTVTLFAKFLGLSMSQPRKTAQ